MTPSDTCAVEVRELTRTFGVRKALDGIDFVIHQAALRSVAKSVERPVPTNDVNVNGTLNLLMMARETGVKRIVYASSSSVYGDCKEYPQKEDFTPLPISPYAVSKLAAEYYCRMFTKTMGVETVSLRYFNVFGPRQNPESKYSAVIPAFIERLAGDQPCIIDGDGLQSRDFTYVDDIARGTLAALKPVYFDGAQHSGYEVINLGSDEPIVLNEAIRLVEELVGEKAKLEHKPRHPADVLATWADISKAERLLGWRPRYSFKDGVAQLVAWYQANQEWARDISTD